MTLTILNRENAPGHFASAFRRGRPGPEKKLVDSFLENIPFCAPRGCHTTVFCEPRIESGFPDLVIVFWSPAVAKKWTPKRLDLTREDIRLLHFLHQVGPVSSQNLRLRLSRPIAANLARLEAADLIYETHEVWQPRPLKRSFAAKRIIAIEAKISEWARVLQQAFQNTWFASDSFVLWPEPRSAEQIRSAANRFGVQLCSPGERVPCRLGSSSSALPRSYVSWLFNEWAWRSTRF